MKRILFIAAMIMFTAQCEEVSIDPDKIAAWTDAFIEEDMANYPIPGVGVVIANGDGVIHMNGYGVADRESQRPFTPEQTVVRAGSVSKCFTAAAIVQLAHEGKLSMDDSVDKYTGDVAIPQPYGTIRVKNLLTHTAGFDDTIVDMHERDVSDWLPLDEYLAKELPPPAMPPNLCTSYSSWDFAIAGLIIEGASGLPYDEYILQHVLEPLGMTRSSFRLPDPPEELLADLASGYNHLNGAYKQYPFDYIKASPGIALLTTTENIGHFITAQLNKGIWNGAQALAPEVIDAMHSTQFTNHEKIRGFTYGFAEWRENGLRIIFHDGNAIGHMGRLLIVPEKNIGFYLAYNIVPFDPGGIPSEAGRLNRRFTTAFLDEFFPETDTETSAPNPVTNAQPPIEDFAGHYRPTNHSRHTFQKLSSLMEQVPVRIVDSGSLIAGSSRYVRIEDDLFQYEEGGDWYVPFRLTEGNVPTHLFFGTGSYEKVSWFESAPTQMAIFAAFLLSFFTMILAGLVRLAIVWNRTRTVGYADVAMLAASAVNMVFFLGLANVMLTLDTMELFAGVPPILAVVLSLPIVSTMLALCAAAIAIRSKVLGNLGRVYHGFAFVIMMAFVPFLWYWNLVGF